jgi:folate-dependent phosphoribosylglycinamide formyltransferase PurN
VSSEAGASFERRRLKVLFLGNNLNPYSLACFRALAEEPDVELALGLFAGRGALRALRRVWATRGARALARRVWTTALAAARAAVRHLGLPTGAARSLSEVAHQRRLPILRAASVNGADARRQIAELAPDLIVMANFGQILRRPLLALPVRGCINVHPSLLPLYRGPDPFYWIVENRETESGVTVHYVDEAIDTGDVILQSRMAVLPGDTERTLRDRAAAESARLLVEAMGLIRAGRAPRTPQVGPGSYYPAAPRGRSRL